MAAKNEVKEYVKNSYYHLYNRGVEKRPIFLDKQDYSVFLSYLKLYLLPKNDNELNQKLANPSTNYIEKEKIIKQLRLKNFCNDLILISYCLMPNHFHFLIYQTQANTIYKFMKSFCTRYSMYFNKKYKRVGPLFQGNYKAVLVETDEQLLYLSHYIHYQALFFQNMKLSSPQPSSYPNYLGNLSQDWVKPEVILSFFNSIRFNPSTNILSYQSFIEGSALGNNLEIDPKLYLD